MTNPIDSSPIAHRSDARDVRWRWKRPRLPGLVVVLLFLMWPCLGRADLVSIGYLSWDMLIPGAPGSPGVNAFTIGNLTGDPAGGGNALPPTFPVLTSLTFENSSLTFIDDGSSQTVLLGDIGPGFYSSPLLEFPDTSELSTALFSATIDSTILSLDGGGDWVASSGQITALLLPSSGNTLIPGTDFQLIDVASATTVAPEPSSCSLILSGLIGVLWLWHRDGQRNK